MTVHDREQSEVLTIHSANYFNSYWIQIHSYSDTQLLNYFHYCTTWLPALLQLLHYFYTEIIDRTASAVLLYLVFVLSWLLTYYIIFIITPNHFLSFPVTPHHSTSLSVTPCHSTHWKKDDLEAHRRFHIECIPHKITPKVWQLYKIFLQSAILDIHSM